MLQNRCVPTIVVLLALLSTLHQGCFVPPDLGVGLVASPARLDFGTNNEILNLIVAKNVSSTPLTNPIRALTNQPWIIPLDCTRAADGCFIESVTDFVVIPVRIDRELLQLGANTGRLTLRTGSASDLVVTVTAEDTLQTNFTVDNQVPRVGQPVRFTDASQTTPAAGPIISRNWDFGDGTTSPATNPTHVYQEPGYYTVSLTVSTANGSETRVRPAFVSVGQTQLGVDFVASETVIFENDAVTFTDVSNLNLPVIGRLWDFGTSSTSSDQSTEESPVYRYTDAGIYTVSLTVTTSAGSVTETKEEYILVQAKVPPLADFNIIGGSTFDAYEDIQFIDASRPGTAPIQWLWDFGDGNTSEEQNPIHAYDVGGTFDVTLTVVSDHGISTKTRQVTILVTPPTAAFSVVGGNVSLEVEAQFTDESTLGTGANPTWLWNFGDGTTSNEQNPTHTYLNLGTFTVTLTVTTTHGSDSTSQQFTVDYAPPVADFVANPVAAIPNQPIAFTDLSTDGSEPINEWFWDFGDGQTSTFQNPAHAYSLPGVYTVSLTVTVPLPSNNTDTVVKQNYITIVNPPVPAFDFESQSAVTTEPVQFINQTVPGTEPSIAYTWDFGDNSPLDTSLNPSHQYAAPGQYTITLTADAPLAPLQSTSRSITVDLPPSPDFTGTPRTILVNETVQFRDESTDDGARPIVSRLWGFGDNSISTLVNPMHRYTQIGQFTVTLDTYFRHSATNELLSVRRTRNNYIRVLAREIVVDTDQDVVDGDTSSIQNLNADRGADNSISLREAILAANNTTGADSIRFESALDISVVSALPALTDRTGGVHILGEGGSIIGTGLLGTENGLSIQSGGNTIEGLTITGFPGNGIEISGIAAIGNLVGTLDPLGLGNTIAGNFGSGIKVTGFDPRQNQFRNNLIHSNGVVGISIPDGGNQGVVAPAMASNAPVGGTAIPDATVEIYATFYNIGRLVTGMVLVETVVADGTGVFVGTQSVLDPAPSGQTVELTATATDANGNTSEFSAPLVVPDAK